MIFEQLQLLLTLYVRPVRAASRIIDHGRLWFAVCAALLVLVALPGGVFLPVDHRPNLLNVAIDPSSAIKMLGAIALVFVPAVILVMTVYRWHESFAVTLRRDYLSFLNCVLLSMTAAFAPLVVLSRFVPFGEYQLALVFLGAAEIYFLILVMFCVRTLWGSGLAMAGLAAAVGLGATFGGLVAFLLLGSLMYFLSSPLVLFYAYILLGSDIRSLGDGLRARQHLRRQLDIAATNPRDGDAHYQIGLIYQQRHQYDEAKRRFTRAMEIDGSEADPVFQLGRIALEEERFTDAIELLRKAAALDDKCCSHEVWRDLGVAYFRSGRLEEARLALSKFVERRSYDPEGLYWYGKTLLGLGRLDDARQQFDECREAV
ncbi:MAG TPA: tetratricopeptide repeat protein, partial [Bryobacteraceae bacterium]|nr:tetratricopeptide repeat protein [Bryobacteraceae bacterium]